MAVLSTSIAAAQQEPSGYSTRFQIVESDSKLDILHGTQAVASYRFAGQSKPIVWPLIGPDSVEMTRKWPMSEDDPSEKKDHIHHRSLWLTHGDVNGVDFWSENDGHGNIVHQAIQHSSASETMATIESINHWIGPGDNKLLLEQRRMVFHGSPEQRLLDVVCRLTPAQGDVVFGDTKEGSFGIRVAESMKVETTPAGTIINAEGLRDGEAWGKASDWVDYAGRIGDKQYGIAIFAHPSSFRAPGRWHVRGYGLFAHNPFGLKDFTGDRNADGAAKLLAGDSLLLAYRIVLHSGNAEQAEIGRLFAEYAKTTIDPFAKIDP